jgi:hypothetical protein
MYAPANDEAAKKNNTSSAILRNLVCINYPHCQFGSAGRKSHMTF